MIRYGLIGLAAFAAGITAAAAETPAERGAYLVNTIMTCQNCHTPKGPNGDIVDKALSGGLTFDEPPFKVTASNITPDPETGIGKWTDAQIKTLMRTGVRPNGVHVAGVMPTGFYGILTESDLDAIVAYLRTVKPINNKVPDPIYKIALPRQVFPGSEAPMPQADFADTVKRGFYLATIGHCMECHSPLGPRGRDFTKLGAGGFEMKGPWGVSVSRNITSSKEKGLGAWSDDEIKRAITQGISRDGSKLKPPMAFHLYARMSAEDLSAIVAYLRTVPAKE